MRGFRSSLAVIVAYSIFAGDVCSQTIINGSFESGAFVPDVNNLMSLPNGSTVINGWTVTNAEIIWGRDDNPFVSPPSDGRFFLDLTGYHDTAPYGGVMQTIATTVGTEYRIAFDLGVLQGVQVYSGPITVRAEATGTAFQDFTYNPGGSGVLWGTFSYDFTATSTSTTLSFLGIFGNQYIGLDNIRFVPVPEPSSLLLVGGSIILLLAYRFRSAACFTTRTLPSRAFSAPRSAS